MTWGQIASGLQTSNTFKEDKLTVTKDGDTYTFTGGELERVFISSHYLDANGKIYFNGVQMDKLHIYTDEGKYYVVLDKDTKAGSVGMSTEENGEAKLVNEGTIGRGEGSDKVIS